MDIAARMLPYATKGQKIGIIPGFGERNLHLRS